MALTRARHRCSVIWGRIGKYATSALGYVLSPPPAGDAPLDVAAIQAHLAALDDGAWRAVLERHARSAPIVLRAPGEAAPREAAPSPESEVPPEAAPERQPVRLAARHPARRVDDRFRTSSFSALTSHAHVAESREELIADHDALAAASAAEAEAPAEGPALELAEFPRGTKAGSFFHDILEHYDFTSSRPGPLEALVADRLASYGYPVELWTQPVARQICAVLDTPLCETEAGPLTLGRVPPGERLNELEFCLPVAGGAEPRTLSAHDLARVFEAHPSDAVPPRYAESVSRLGFVPLAGFLRGFIDLTFRHDGRFYLVDYKANHLGSLAHDYSRERLKDAMLRGQYYLQYHLYALALHRYLARRIAGYAYERHFGGAYYLFIKGMGPGLGASGVFHEKPPLERLLALGALLERARGSARAFSAAEQR